MSCKKLEAAQCWLVRQGPDWALIIVSNETGPVSIDSSYGKYTNTWHPAHIGEKTVVEFLIGLNFDYAMEKFLGSRSHFDAKATVKMYREQILQYRLLGDIEADDARKYWNELGELGDYLDLTSFYNAVNETNFADWLVDWWEFGCHTHPPQARMFWDRMWPEFKEAAAAEPAESKAVGT